MMTKASKTNQVRHSRARPKAKQSKSKQAKLDSIDDVVDDLIAHTEDNVGYPDMHPTLSVVYNLGAVGGESRRVLERVGISHLPSNIQSMVASLRRDHSLSDVPEDLTADLRQHSGLVEVGARGSPLAIQNLVKYDPYAISANWGVGQGVKLSRNNRPDVDRAMSFLRSPEARGPGPMVHFVRTHDKGKDHHATVAVVYPDGRIAYYDPDLGPEANSGLII